MSAEQRRPYLTAIIVVIAMFRASGAMDMITNLCSGFLNKINFPADILHNPRTGQPEGRQ